jgi:hypothetical protein
MIDEPRIYSGTGHRPDELGGYGEDTMEKLTDFAVSILPTWEPDKIISGMALGWDQALARAAHLLGFPWIAAVAFKGQESIWPKASQIAFHDLLSKATEVVIVCEGGYEPWKLQKRNEWMVDHCTDILALWNGVRDGGTYNCIEYARKVGRPVHNLWPGWESLNSSIFDVDTSS